MIKKIGILILIGIISMCTVIPIALADNNDDQDVDDVITVKDEGGNIFKMIWYKITSTLSFSENGEETTIDVEEEHPGGKVNHGAIVSIIARIINKVESVVGKTRGMIMRAIAKTNWGKQIEEKDSSDDDIDINDKEGKPEKGKKPTDIPPKKSIEVLEIVFDRIINTLFVKQNDLLYKIKEKVPEKAQPAIQRAIENNVRKMERMEEIKAHVLERVKNRNLNNE
ncbi:unnamed protein product [marine sediment metagenome]|uniref:Uncharacterized protein n=1 Tax=marine sediment metagenome TaxID=412755 RepID=X1AQP7_9ZZZZ